MRRPDRESRALNTIESELWTSDPEFYRQFNQAWRPGDFTAAVPKRTWSAVWMLPVALIVSGVLLCLVLVQSR